MINLLIVLVAFTAADGQPIMVNPREVVVIRGPSKTELLTRGTSCVLGTTDGRFVAVREDCNTVRQSLEGK